LDIVNSIYVVITIALMLRLHQRDKNLTKAKVLYALIVLCCLTRIAIEVIPDDYYTNHVQNNSTLQMWVDILPELMFFASYFLLLIMWLEMYYLMKIREASKAVIFKRMWLLYLGIIAVEFVAGLIFSIGIGATGPYSAVNLQKEAIFLAAISFILSLAFPVGGLYLFRRLRDAPGITSLKKKNMMIPLRRLLVVVIVCSLSHMGYTLFLEVYFDGLIPNQVMRAVIWWLYFVVTEQLPTGLIILLLTKMTAAKVTKHKTQVTISKNSNLLHPLLQEDRQSVINATPGKEYKSMDRV